MRNKRTCSLPFTLLRLMLVYVISKILHGTILILVFSGLFSYPHVTLFSIVSAVISLTRLITIFDF